MIVFHIALKDIRIFLKDRGSLFLLFLLPLLFIVVLSGALGAIGSGEKDERIPLPVVNLDNGQTSQTLLQMIDSAGGVRAELYQQAQADELLAEKKILRLLTIPADFSSRQ